MSGQVHVGTTLGIDTHKLTHVAAIVDGLGRLQGTFAFAATDDGAAAMLVWAAAHGSPGTAGVEGTGSYGYQLTRTLNAAGITVFEVNRPDRANRRRKGKSDPVDAELSRRPELARDSHCRLSRARRFCPLAVSRSARWWPTEVPGDSQLICPPGGGCLAIGWVSSGV